MGASEVGKYHIELMASFVIYDYALSEGNIKKFAKACSKTFP